ncbi:MAG TPA: PAC2 family protein [Actinomycetales bacterium]|nr:PAC2 family protein [Actinomycetales bacterium]
MSTHDQGQPPILVVAFEGWNDAGSAATTAVDLLADEWEADLVDVVDGDGYYDLQVNRPIVSRDEDGNRIITWPGTDVMLGHLPSGRRVVLMHSVEPSLRWRSFVEDLLEVADTYGATEVYTLGALLADVPHTRNLPTNATSSSSEVRERLGLRTSEYEGPTGIVGVFDSLATARGYDAVSLWVSVPHYVSDMPSPKAAAALISALAAMLEVPVELPELAEEAERWESAVTELTSDNPEIEGYVAQLESTRDAAESAEATGDAIAAEFERYLRRHGK